jgi:hypothetical protein
MVLTGWALLRRTNVSPVRYELGFYITDDIFIVTALKTSNLTWH